MMRLLHFDPDKLDVAQLARAAAQGDARAVAALHTRYGVGVRNFFSQRGLRSSDADDAAQQVWATVWEAVRAGRYDPARAGFGTFLYAFARFVWLRHRRAAQRSAVTLSEHADASGTRTPAAAAMHAEVLTALRDCCDPIENPAGLSPPEFAAIAGFTLGRSERELAAELDLAASTVHEIKRSAIAKLRRCLARKGISGETVEQIFIEGE